MTRRKSGRSGAKRGAGRGAARRPARRRAAPPAKTVREKTGPATASRTRRKPTGRRRVRSGATARRRSGASTFRPVAVRFARRVAVIAALVLLAFTGLFGWYARDLPDVSRLDIVEASPRIVVTDREGGTIGVHGRDQGPPVDPANLPPHVVQAFLATEDRNFYHHLGVNPVAILRAALVNARAGGVAQGGSTITQQLVKNTLLTPERTLKRKAQEVLLSVRIERAYDKDEILALYLNRVYFGGGAYGLEAAARRYFGVAPADLDVGQAAMLAGLLKAPSRLAPSSAPEAARKRASVVLSAMVAAGYLTRSEADAIEARGIAEAVPRDRSGAHAADAAMAEARGLLGGLTRDLIVRTTIDPDAMRAASAAADEVMAADRRTRNAELAVVLAEETGAVRVMIGGRDYAASSFNRATSARRAPGSVFKPFVYLAAIEAGWRPEDLIDDSPIVVDTPLGPYAPDNYKDRYHGEVSLTEALSRSLNAGAVRLQEAVGRDRVVSTAWRAGLLETRDVGPSLALGVTEQTPMEVLSAYMTLSSGGVRAEPYLVEAIETPDGSALWRRAPSPPRGPRFDEADMIALGHMMRAVVTDGSGHRARLAGHEAAGKTGTGQDSRDAWFAGYASGMAGVVWIGNDDNAPMGGEGAGVSGAGAPAIIWQRAMTTTLADTPPRAVVPYEPMPVEPEGFLDYLADMLRREREPDAVGRLIEDVSG